MNMYVGYHPDAYWGESSGDNVQQEVLIGKKNNENDEETKEQEKQDSGKAANHPEAAARDGDEDLLKTPKMKSKSTIQ